MGYASRSGRATTSTRNPRAFAVCQRCGTWENRDRLKFQHDWRGARIENIWILVCDECYDIPQEQLRAIVLPADPVPVFYPSVENFEQDETDYRAISLPPQIDPRTGLPIPSTTLRTTEDCKNRTLTPFGQRPGLDQNAVMPWDGAAQEAFRTPLPLLSVIANGSPIVTVTCSAVHNLTTDDQISAQGLSIAAACGTYSVTVVTATMFTYMTYGSIPPGNLLQGESNILTCLVGLPYGYKQIPKINGGLLTVPLIGVDLLELENSLGFFGLENSAGAVELEEGP